MTSQGIPLRVLDQLSIAGHRKIGKRLECFSRFSTALSAAGRRVWPASLRKKPRTVLMLSAGLSLTGFAVVAYVAFRAVLPAMAAGLAVGVSFSWAIMRWNMSRMLRSGNLSRVTSFSYDGEALSCSFCPDLPLELQGTPSRIVVAALSALASIIVLLGMSAQQFMLSGIPQEPGWLHGLIARGLWLTPIVTGVALFNERHLQKVVVWQFTQEVKRLSCLANSELRQIREVDGILTGIDALCRLLNVEPPAEHRAAIAKFVVRNPQRSSLIPRAPLHSSR